MNELKEQRFAVKFCVKLGKSATETFAMLNTAYIDSIMKRATYFRWHEHFKDGQQSIEDDERPVHHEYLPVGFTVNQAFQIGVLKRQRNCGV